MLQNVFVSCLSRQAIGTGATIDKSDLVLESVLLNQRVLLWRLYKSSSSEGGYP